MALQRRPDGAWSNGTAMECSTLNPTSCDLSRPRLLASDSPSNGAGEATTHSLPISPVKNLRSGLRSERGDRRRGLRGGHTWGAHFISSAEFSRIADLGVAPPRCTFSMRCPIRCCAITARTAACVAPRAGSPSVTQGIVYMLFIDGVGRGVWRGAEGLRECSDEGIKAEGIVKKCVRWVRDARWARRSGSRS